MNNEHTYDLVIIGGGPAGLTAGIYAVRASLKTVLLEAELPGGQVNEAPSIENYPGFPEISGLELAQKMRDHAVTVGLTIQTRPVTQLAIKDDWKIIQTTEKEIKAKAVIIATGAKPKRLKAKGEEELLGHGVSYCAICDGPFFRNKDVVAVGGGDRALKEGLFLSNIVNKLYVVHRRDTFRGEKINVERLEKKDNVEFILDSVIEEIKGQPIVNSVIVKNLKTDKLSELNVNGAFIFVGIVPRNDFINAEKDAHGFLITDSKLETSIKGVFAAGDCRSKPLRQVATAVGEGAQAVYSVEEYLQTVDLSL